MILLSSCEEKCISTEAKERAEVIQGLEIVKDYSLHMCDTNWYYSEKESHEMAIFSYEFENEHCLNVFDDEKGFHLKFTHYASENEIFKFVDSEILSSLAYYSDTGAHGSYIGVPIDQGIIEGYKISDEIWQIEVDVTVYHKKSNYPKKIKFSAQYTIK